ncbi:MAG TPA: TetR/AcrR family transcriptional regulator [Candidatus Corynebacterium avicola]|uniref:TetR/AcrR family transcriptional regulator n=1 Tax=Candidatus Corynebacterium avicola TaxID=2838527 RepID=A0A9D1ULG9_9CORY|nr:TetR/AcrR family transcriptional regulator [Candidatus Corynebacterium avicola]
MKDHTDTQEHDQTRDRILDGALALLNDAVDGSGKGSVSLDSAAKQAGVTKPGLMYHFPTKEALMLALVDHVVDRWEEQLIAALGGPLEEAGPVDRIRAYAEFTLGTEFENSDIVMLADPRLRPALTARWGERIAPWVGLSPAAEKEPDSASVSATYDGLDVEVATRLHAVRLMADGAWLASATGVLDPGKGARADVLVLAREMLDDLDHSDDRKETVP